LEVFFSLRFAKMERPLPDQEIDDHTTNAMAHLPGLEIEIVHRKSPAGADQISINLEAVPSFEAFGRFLETANPFVLWAQAAQMAWFPRLRAASAMLPLSVETPKLSQKNKELGM
jgi:hypothetical protein